MALSPGRLFRRGSWREARFVTSALRTESVGGALLLGAAVVALAWANSPWHASYTDARELRVGPAALHLDLTLGQWAADGLLAVFFLVAGTELKRELVAGDLADRSRAVVPVAAALAGVALPALLYAGTVRLTAGGSEALAGWAIPTATDIAFALAVLAVLGTHLPSALRAFLLTLAVVDDVVAITIIAVFYTTGFTPLPLVGAGVAVGVFGWLLRRGVASPVLLAVPAVLAWYLTHSAGVHATVAGVLLGLVVPARKDPGTGAVTLAERLEHRLRPFSAGVAVPLFALSAAGVRVVDGGLSTALRDPVTLGVVVGLLVGKPVGVFTATWAVARFTRAKLDEDLSWSDVAGLSLLTGLGFTVSLLIGQLAFGAGTQRDGHVRIAVLLGSLLAALAAAVVLRRREAHYRLIARREARDDDGDGIPDLYPLR